MIDINHEEKRGKPFCPKMGEPCVKGWTKSMGQDGDGTRPTCVAWRGIPMIDKEKNTPREVHACALYEWPVFQNFEITTLLQHNRSGMDKIATEVNMHHASFIGALSGEARQRLLDADPKPIEKEGEREP